MKILILSHTIPYPPHKDGLVHTLFSLLPYFRQQDDDIKLLCLTGTKDQATYFARFNIPFECLYLKPSSRKIGGFLKSLGAKNPIPWHLAQYDLPEAHQSLCKEIYDRAVIFPPTLVLYANDLDYRKTAIVTHDSYSLLFKTLVAETSGVLKKAYLTKQAQWTEKVEKAYFPRVQQVITVSKRDRDYLKSLGIKNVSAIPIGVETKQFPLVRRATQPVTLIFTGILSYIANADAVRHFVRNIWPVLKNQLPSVKLKIIGKNPPADIASLPEKDSRIIVTGFVPDVATACAGGTIYISPLTYGTGAKNKILEAMSMGFPCVVSPETVIGTTVADQKEVMVAKNQREFIDKIITLAADPATQNTLARQARRYVEINHSWSKIADEYLATIKK